MVNTINQIGVLEVDPKKKPEDLNYHYYDERIQE
jgi:hypothetical protein